MRLHRCKNIDEYIKQLQEDIEILKFFQNLYNVGNWDDPMTSNFFDANRDACENHSEAISSHRSHLRSLRINAKQDI